MQNPWKKLPENPPFILDIDKNIIDKHKDSLDSLHYIYPVKYFNTNKSDNKTKL
jgi:hypothetical protein